MALVSKDEYANTLDGYRIICKDEIIDYVFDYLVIFNERRFGDIKKDAIKIGIEEEKIINGKVFGIPYFDFNKYVSLIQNPVTIISDDCWGGIIYHYLNLKICSPFVNYFLKEADYFKLLSNFNYYISIELMIEQEGDLYECKIPSGYLGNEDDKVIINFNHHLDFASAKKD